MAKSQMATAGSPARPPSRLPATRESRPALIGLAAILIVGGALASAWLAVQSGNRAYFLQIDEEVAQGATISDRSEEHTSELQSRGHLVCRLLLEKKKPNIQSKISKTKYY